MKIHVYSIFWNEETFMPYYLRHYETFANKIVLFDNCSTDRSREIAEAHPLVEMWDLETWGLSDDSEMTDLKNTAWKESRGVADWVVVCDMDELIYHRDVRGYLRRCQSQGITIPRPVGYQMFSDAFPSTSGQIYTEVTKGVRDERLYSKMAVFDPNEISDISYYVGAHDAAPAGNVRIEWPSELKLLHFRFLGDEYVLHRCTRMQPRIHPQAITNRWCVYDTAEQMGVMRYVRSQSQEVLER